MKAIGIDNDDYQIYGGSTYAGRLLTPSPTILIAHIFNSTENNIGDKIVDNLCVIKYVFFDDGYDPVSRVRKGRIYSNSGGMQPHQWSIRSEHVHTKKLPLVTFSQFSLIQDLRNQQISAPVIALGSKNQFTLWSLIDIESTVAHESVLYLKARKAFGVIPEIDYEKIFEPCRERVRDKIGTLLDEIHTAGPESVVDRCREALTSILSAYIQEHDLGDSGQDLGTLAKVLENNKNHVVANLSRVVAIFHSRSKNAEQEKRNVRPLTEQDAEMAIQSVTIVLHDLGLVLPTLGNR